LTERVISQTAVAAPLETGIAARPTILFATGVVIVAVIDE
jgi:hypothetical protein